MIFLTTSHIRTGKILDAITNQDPMKAACRMCLLLECNVRLLKPKGIDHFHSHASLEDLEDCSVVDLNSHCFEPMPQHKGCVHIHGDHMGREDLVLLLSVHLVMSLVSN